MLFPSFLDDILEAYNLIKDVDPATPQEYILKGVVNAVLGQEQGSVSNTLLADLKLQMFTSLYSSL